MQGGRPSMKMNMRQQLVVINKPAVLKFNLIKSYL